MLRVITNDVYSAASPDDFTLITHGFNTCSNFHTLSLHDTNIRIDTNTTNIITILFVSFACIRILVSHSILNGT